MQIDSTAATGHAGPPAFVLLAGTAFVLSMVWTIPLQWMAVRRMVREMGAGRLAGHVAVSVVTSALGGGVPVLLACGLLADVATAAGLSAEWVERAFILVLRREWLQIGFLLGWIALGWIATSAVEAAVLRRLWRRDAVPRSTWSVAWRANGLGYIGLAALAVILARNP